MHVAINWNRLKIVRFFFDFYPPLISIEQGLTNPLVPKFSKNETKKLVKRDREEISSIYINICRKFFAIPFDQLFELVFQKFWYQSIREALFYGNERRVKIEKKFETSLQKTKKTQHFRFFLVHPENNCGIFE